MGGERGEEEEDEAAGARVAQNQWQSGSSGNASR